MTLMALGDTARFINGAAFKPSDWEESGLPIIRIQNLTGTGEKFNLTTRKVKPELIVEPGDLLVSWSATLDVYRWSGPRGVLNQHIFKVLPNADIDPEYLFYALKNALAELSSKTHGSTMKHVVRGDFESTKVNVPPLPEQRRIVDLLSRAEGIVRLRREAEKKAAELIPALFLDMFGDPATNPKGWPVAHLGEIICDGPQNGLYKHASHYGDGTPILRIDAFYDGRVTDLNALKRLRATPEEQAKFRLFSRNIVINRVNSPEYLGKSAIIPALNEEMVFESNMMRFATDEALAIPEYVIDVLQTSHAKSHFLSNAKHAINQSSINQQDVKSLSVPLPPVDLQWAFAERKDDIFSIQSQQSTATAKAKATFDALLAQAFSA
ncbi:MAG: restriction endonuclease subunit S [Azonexus sp.]|nr:restriction endonuclease subunit S [Azonexus sp.]